MKKLRDLGFTQVLVDEAQSASELEILGLIGNAKQLVLVGDTKQLSQTTSYEIQGSSSLFERLVNIDSDLPLREKFCVRLDTQFRIHPQIWNSANKLFYDNKILTQIKPISLRNKFLDNEKPILFVDIKG